MGYVIREYTNDDIIPMLEIWNTVVEEGVAFPQTECLNENTAAEFFALQSYTAVAEEEASGEIAGLYILHPNNIGRCGHLANASYAVKKNLRGKRIGRLLVEDCINRARRLGFGIMQFNAVVKTNVAALRLYESLGFVRLGVIPKGFRMKDGSFEDIIPHYLVL